MLLHLIRCKTTLIFCCILLFMQQLAFAQSATWPDVEKQTDTLVYTAWQKLVITRYNEVTGNFSSKKDKDLLDLHAERLSSIKQKFTDKELVTDSVLHNYLNGLVGRLVAANPELQPVNPVAFLSRSTGPMLTHGYVVV